MPENNDTDVQKIAEQIERYLLKHPNAADTIEGIWEWWLQGVRIETSCEIVQQALDYLDSKLVVKSNINLSGNRVYSGNKPKTEQQPN